MKLRVYLKKGNKNYEKDHCSMRKRSSNISDSSKQGERYMDSSVAYIAITKIDKEYPIPVINGIAFLTGVGQDAELKKLIEACK